MCPGQDRQTKNSLKGDKVIEKWLFREEYVLVVVRVSGDGRCHEEEGVTVVTLRHKKKGVFVLTISSTKTLLCVTVTQAGTDEILEMQRNFLEKGCELTFLEEKGPQDYDIEIKVIDGQA